MLRKHSLLFGFLLAVGGGAVSASDGIEDGVVHFAQVAALDGPAGALGSGMRDGILAAFAEANAAGGVHGRMLELDSYDDGYEPNQAIDLVNQVIGDNNHIGFIGPVGTPTSRAVQPIATEANMPFIGPFTGAGFLRDPALTNVLNVRATYDAETEEWIRHLVDEKGMQNIAILYQDDGFGRVGLAGVNAALERRGMSLVAEGTYTRNTTAVRAALLDIRKAEPDAVVMVGAYSAIGEFVRLSRKLSFDPAFVTISFVGSRALVADLGADGEGVIISQVVPFPWDASIPLVAAYQAAMQAHAPGSEPGFVTLEGYVVGRLAVEALKAAGPDLTRDALLNAMTSLGTVDISGTVLNFGPGDNQGMDEVFLTAIGPNGTFVSQ